MFCRGPLGFGEHYAECMPETCLCNKEGWWHLGLPKHYQQTKGGNAYPLLSPSETNLELCFCSWLHSSRETWSKTSNELRRWLWAWSTWHTKEFERNGIYHPGEENVQHRGRRRRSLYQWYPVEAWEKIGADRLKYRELQLNTRREGEK